MIMMGMMPSGASNADDDCDEHDSPSQGTDPIKCPLCQVMHLYAPTKVDAQIFPSGVLPCTRCSQPCASQTSMAFPCGHVLCDKDCGGTKMACIKCSTSTNDFSLSSMRFSHGAGLVRITNGGSEFCAVCLEQFDSYMVSLPCGHMFCEQDFINLGGLMGNQVLLSRQEMLEPARRDRMTDLRGQVTSPFVQIQNALVSLKNACQQANSLNAENALMILCDVFPSDGAALGADVFTYNGGQTVVAGAVESFPGNPRVIFFSSWALSLLCCPSRAREQTPRLAKSIVSTPGLVCKFIDTLGQRDKLPEPVINCVYKFLKLIFRSNQTSVVDLEMILRALQATSLQKHLDEPKIVFRVIALIGHLLQGAWKSIPQHVTTTVSQLNVLETLISTMERHSEVAGVSTICMEVVSHEASLRERIASAQLVRLAIQAMDMHELDVSLLECGCTFLRVMANCQTAVQNEVKQSLLTNRAVETIEVALQLHPDAVDLYTQACWTLETFAAKIDGMAGTIVQSECIYEVLEKLDRFGSLENVSFGINGADLLHVLSKCPEPKVRLALTDSTALAVLVQMGREISSFIRQMVERETITTTVNPVAAIAYYASVKRALNAFGYPSVYQDDSEFDDKLSPQPVEAPPFNVSSILSKDLSSDDVPGWYQAWPFFVDASRSQLLAVTHDESFLIPQPNVSPAANVNVCIRVALPFGGRGYLYGKTTRVFPSPTDEKLRASTSKRFEKPCTCSNPDCIYKTGSREEYLGVYGVLHGQEVTATVSLTSPFFERKLRYSPLLAFFANHTKFNVTLRWNDSTNRYEIVELTVA